MLRSVYRCRRRCRSPSTRASTPITRTSIPFESMPCVAMGPGPSVHLGRSMHEAHVDVAGADTFSGHMRTGYGFSSPSATQCEPLQLFSTHHQQLQCLHRRSRCGVRGFLTWSFTCPQRRSVSSQPVWSIRAHSSSRTYTDQHHRLSRGSRWCAASRWSGAEE